MVSSSRFGALRALSVAALVSSALALPHLSAPAGLSKRSLQDYVDHLVYLDASKSSLYAAVEIGGQTYGATLDNHWGGLLVKSNLFSGSTSQINVEGVSVTVTKGHETIGFLQEDIEIDYYSTSQWPQSWPSIGSSAGVGYARVGMDITDPNSVINQYLAAKWSNILDNWYYDLLVFYDWQGAASSQSVEIDFAGIITTGSTLDWSSVFGIDAGEASKYGLPDLSSIKDQPYIYLRKDGTFYADKSFWANGKQVDVRSGVSQTPSESVVVEIDLTARFSTFPDAVVQALYGSLPGAKYFGHSNYGYWQFSCDAQPSFWFTIGGKKYEVTSEALVAPNPWGDKCVGSVFTRGHGSASSQWDVVFGFQFLSSFYYRAGISHQSGQQPYMKLLPLPAPSDGWASSGNAWSWSNGGSGLSYSDSASATAGGNKQGSWTATTSAWNGSPTYGADPSSAGGNGQYTYGADGSKGTGRSTSTIFTTTTHTVIGTTTVAWPAGSTGSSSSSGSSSGYSGSGSSSDEGYSGSGSGSGSGYADKDNVNLAVGNVAETDADGNDLNLPHGSIAEQLKHCLPAIIVLAVVIALGTLGGVIACLVRRRRGGGGGAGPSAYRNLHDADTHGPVNVPLYGAEEGHSKYADPYQDKE
ncbi:hypothetical protein C8Q77DRAFT_1174556 [Trametes polyzona]|nr:hypothetical protein C8Q77DRAFT_1174556 [Trametes polyzona]